MIWIIESEQYGKIEIDEKSSTARFCKYDVTYLISEHNTFYDIYDKLWKVEFVGNDVILKVTEWKEIGRTKL